MLDLGQLFKRADTVQRHLAAPLARSRLAYLGHRAEEGAKPSRSVAMKRTLIRNGPYRALYVFNENEVLILDIEHRKNAYRRT